MSNLTGLLKAKVNDLVGNYGEWDWSLMSWIPADTKLKIAAISPPYANTGEDKFLVATNEDGSFVIGRMYENLTNFMDSGTRKVWSLIWKLQVPKRVRNFVWILKHNRLLTHYRMSQRGYGSDDCRSCGAASESPIHALRDCRSVRKVWENRVLKDIMHLFFQLDWNEWVNINIVMNMHAGEG